MADSSYQAIFNGRISSRNRSIHGTLVGLRIYGTDLRKGDRVLITECGEFDGLWIVAQEHDETRGHNWVWERDNG